MQPDAKGELVNAGIYITAFNDYNFLTNNFRYTVKIPGVYAIVQTVFDFVSNYARARKLFVYTGDTQMTS